MAGSGDWWRRAVVYQVYIRSFADGDGDGVGDIAGIRSRLPYLRELGVDALWITPWYPSPMADGGYDVADYTRRRPDVRVGRRGRRADRARRTTLGLRVLLDLVPNHTSSAHPWFAEALAARARVGGPIPVRVPRGPRHRRCDRRRPTGSASSAGRPGAGDRGRRPAGQWYLHQFAIEQPDLDWDNPEVRAMFEDVLRTWFDRGVDGFRIDVANSLVKDLSAMRDAIETRARGSTSRRPARRARSRTRTGCTRSTARGGASRTPQTRHAILLGEVHAPTLARLARYVRPDELHSAFNFPFLRAGWDAGRLRR